MRIRNQEGSIFGILNSIAYALAATFPPSEGPVRADPRVYGDRAGADA
jgi:hypothetical protein